LNIYTTGVGFVQDERNQLLSYLKAFKVTILKKEADKMSIEDLRKKYDQVMERKKT